MRSSFPRAGRQAAVRNGVGWLGDRLRWQFRGLEERPERRERAAMAKASVYMLGGGATMGLLMMLLPGSASRSDGVTAALLAVSAFVAAICLAGADRLPRWFLAATPAIVTALITADLLFAGDDHNGSWAFYFVVALYAFTLLPVPAAAAHIGLIAVSQVMVVVARPEIATPDTAVVTIAVLAATAYAIVRSNRRLKELVCELTASRHAIRRSAEETVTRLSHAAEARDAAAGDHVRRVGQYCYLLARELGLGRDRAELIRTASILHDIGKIAIPDEVLQKAGPLDMDDVRVVRGHAAFGHKILAGSGDAMLDVAAAICLTHHERWDGNGYPDGLAGDAIPIEGRIAAVADVFDSLTSVRVYRSAHSVPDAFAIMARERGAAFDPDVLDAFFRLRETIAEIASAPREAGTADAPVPVAAVA